jgi:zinc protease
LGQHRNSGGRLFERMRQARGLNYGDYVYIEYFPRGMFQFEPDPNLGRRQQIFQIWIRPVEPQNAHFALRLALYEFDRLIKQGLSEEEFQRSVNFVGKYVDLLTKTKDAELGYKIDSIYYGVHDYGDYVKKGLRSLTRNAVNSAIRRNLGNRNFDIVAVAEDADGLKKKIAGNEPSPIAYNSPKPEEILAEDKIVQEWKIDIEPEDIKIISVEQVFQ